MTEEQVRNTIRAFLAALQARDTNKALSLIAQDCIWESPHGVFNGKPEVKRYIDWTVKTTPDSKITETGIKIIARGDIGVIEHILSGTYEGKEWKLPAICIYEFAGDEIKSMRTYFDRLSLADQVAKGVMARGAVSAIINAMQKGLR